MKAKPLKTIKWTQSIYGEDYHLGKVIYRANGYFGPVIQDRYLLITILEGEMTVTTDLRRYVIQRNEACLIFPKEKFTLCFSSQGETFHQFATIPTENIPSAHRHDFSQAPSGIPCSPHLNTQIDLAVELATSTYPDRDQQVQQIARSVFYEYHRLLTQPKEGKNVGIERALTFIYANYAEPIDADQIARAAGLSRPHLTKLLSTKTGKGIGEHLWTYRVEKAYSLLINTGLQISEIADQTGFQNPYHLSRKMKQRYGAPPKKLRQQAWSI